MQVNRVVEESRSNGVMRYQCFAETRLIRGGIVMRTYRVPMVAVMVTLLLLGTAAVVAADDGAAGPTVTVKSVNADRIGLYEKFEVLVGLENAVYSNPYDPDQIDLRAYFTSPSGKNWEIYGFYDNYQGVNQWKVRFSPNEVGEWTYRLKVTDSRGMTGESEVYTFTAVPSEHHGWIRVSPDNPRYLMYSDGTSFYGIGVCYLGEKITTAGLPAPHRRPNLEFGLDDLAAHGVNFFTGVGATLLESMESGLGRYDQDKCGYIDQCLEWAEEREMCVAFNLSGHREFSETVFAEHLWENNPYKRLCSSENFFSSQEAWGYFEKRIRYVIARWGYSRSIAIWIIIGEANGTEAWDKGHQAEIENWVFKVNNYLKTHDPYHHLTTATLSGQKGGAYWKTAYEITDLPVRKLFEKQGWPVDVDNPFRSSIKNYVETIQKLRNDFPEKPAIIGDTGSSHVYVSLAGIAGQSLHPSPEYRIIFHNAIWTGLANGLAMTPWWDKFPWFVDENMLGQFKVLSQFVSDIDFAHLPLVPGEVSVAGCDAYAMVSENMSFGWIRDEEGADISGRSFTISGLPDGLYVIQWYDTWTGTVTGLCIRESVGGTLSGTIPTSYVYSGRDLAFKVAPFDKVPRSWFGLPPDPERSD